MLELYHSINSVCAQKVRIALAEKDPLSSSGSIRRRGLDSSNSRMGPATASSMRACS